MSDHPGFKPGGVVPKGQPVRIDQRDLPLLPARALTPAIPGPDPVDTATQWLNLHSDCDIECKQNHPVNHSTVSGLHAAAATARIAAAEYKRERDEARHRLMEAIEVIAGLRRNRESWSDAQLDVVLPQLDPGVGL